MNDAIIYHFLAKRILPWKARLHRVAPFMRIKSNATEELWISRAGWTGMREVGHIAAAQEKQIERLEFLPDGRHISFVYHGKLYMMATEGP